MRKSIESKWSREALRSFIDMLFYHVRPKCFVVVN